MVDLAATPHESNEAVLEMRYRPNARILDRRGSWAELLSAHLELPHWQVIENRVDIFTEDRKQHVFVGFRNCGVVYQDVPSHNYFTEQAVRFLKKLFSFHEFGDPVHVERLGVRLRFAVPSTIPFGLLVQRFAQRYVLMAPAAQAIFADATLEDIGAPLNFSDGVGHFNSMAGPMPQEQFQAVFREKEGLPETGLYIDVDYWFKPNALNSLPDITNKTRAFAQAADRRAMAMKRLILPED